MVDQVLSFEDEFILRRRARYNREMAKVMKMSVTQSAMRAEQQNRRIQMSIGGWYMDADGCLTREIKNAGE